MFTAFFQEERDIGLMMPCNLVVYEDGGNVFVASVLPTQTMAVVRNAKLESTALQIEDKLKKVIDNI